jgi:TorA maturation chaperone TorD
MTGQEKAPFCQILATLFYPPNQELVKQIYQGNIYSFFQKYSQPYGKDTDLIRGFFMEGDPKSLLKDLSEAYESLFGLGGESISLVESYYKPWTLDPHWPLPFASSKGLLMGDSALHLLEIYRLCNLEVAEEFRGRPDHLALELEFLSYLYRWATDLEVKQFIEDHLDWISLLKEKLKRFDPHPFYVSTLEILDLFLKRERERLEVEGNGEKKIH